MSPSVDLKNNSDFEQYKKKVKNNMITENKSSKCACANNKIDINKSKYKRSISECDISNKNAESSNEKGKTKNRSDTLSTLDILKDEHNKVTGNKSTYNRLLSYLKRLKRSMSSK